MTVLEIVKAALRKIQAYASGEDLETADQADAITALQIMLRSWAGRKLLVFASTQDTLTLVSGTGSYTWGESASYNINSAPPNQIVSAYILDSSGYTHELKLHTKTQYNEIQNKTLSDRPKVLCCDYAYPSSNLILHPVPVDAETLYLESFKAFTETSSFDLSTSTLKFPKHYEEAIIYNLAIRLAPEYGKSVSDEVVAIARDSFSSIVALNAANKIDFVNLNLAIPAGLINSNYNINEG